MEVCNQVRATQVEYLQRIQIHLMRQDDFNELRVNIAFLRRDN